MLITRAQLLDGTPVDVRVGATIAEVGSLKARPGEDLLDAAHRRLREEMGFDCALQPLFSFVYHAPFANGFTEHELDHVFVGRFDGHPRPDPEEADEWRWADPARVLESIAREPESYSVWFRLALHRVLEQARA